MPVFVIYVISNQHFQLRLAIGMNNTHTKHMHRSIKSQSAPVRNKAETDSKTNIESIVIASINPEPKFSPSDPIRKCLFWRISRKQFCAIENSWKVCALKLLTIGCMWAIMNLRTRTPHRGDEKKIGAFGIETTARKLDDIIKKLLSLVVSCVCAFVCVVFESVSHQTHNTTHSVSHEHTHTRRATTTHQQRHTNLKPIYLIHSAH